MNAWVLDVEDRDHGAVGFADDAADEVERMFGVFSDADDRDIEIPTSVSSATAAMWSLVPSRHARDV